ncbi:sterol desaturase family protein [Marinomonas mediterranea]|jgi:Sterol desaturase|uniref:Fatty acid hydroxylase n=1 Tax=Marinomonas mediterranea (strain ATCC 700492 / JCM 21426 / NBRC 103028 / MMB-1) TaxID=717774 RepID=F2K2R8_MARM1|nr:sterol desaturase family protein [Marinomonas mediterranea]ADZ91201.1 fatty acid hydroxylase [Marinomonas mediterranea MMB-1]WCN13259.1 sterol desaturase family protein [Marinomonas mediterranea]WCN17327.1 sterol desaturase family protein [Marinomonas mediterranea MMB-1]
MEEQYEYRERNVEKDTSKEFRFGEGRISGIASLMLGVLSLLAVLAYLYPSYLTTTELRKVYDAEQLQVVLKYGMYFSLLLGGLTFLLNKGRYKAVGVCGIGLTLVAFALGGYSVPVGPVEPKALSLGVDWLILAFLGSVIVFVTLEKLFPRYRDQLIMRPEWGTDMFYFCFNHLAISAILLFANYHTSHFSWAVSTSIQEMIRSIPIWGQVVLIVLCADFVLYWEHRLYHEVNALWPIHAVHHSVEHMDWLAGSRGHFVQVFSERAMVMIPLYLLGPDQVALNIYVTFAALQAILIHSNLSIPFGPLKFVLVTPQFHHWHHSSEKPAIDTNYSAHTVLFDAMFNTMHMPGKHWPAEFGTTVRLPRSVIGHLFYPITANLKRFKINKR